MGGVSFWTFGGRVCDGENPESVLANTTVLGVDGVVLPPAGCGRVGINVGCTL
jgi:hypothetical protein